MPPKKIKNQPVKPGAKEVRRGGALLQTSAAEYSDCEWRFRERAKQDGRSFGNAALYATPQEIDSLVRETGQNSLDAASESHGRRQVIMRYRLVELPNGSARREHFLKAIRWESGLKPHLDAVAKAQGKATNTAARVRSALDEMAGQASTLWLLAVEDFGTRGLEGGEFDPNAPYCALVRDSENSNKNNEGAGGSFGLGSKTLWACSDLLTVIFASEPESEGGRTRLIGKADLGFHEFEGGATHGYVGHGHLGRPLENDAAESHWIESRDAELLKRMCISRTCPVEGASSTGTTALIVGFADPKADKQTAEGILGALERAVARNFWPAIVRRELRVFLRHERGDQYAATDFEVNPEKHLPSFVDAFQKQEAGKLADSLQRAGDVVSVPVQHVVPATKSFVDTGVGHANVTAEARLVIRLSEATTPDYDLRDHVALIRGRAMVVKYVPKRNVTLGARPFHAVLAAGTLIAKSGHQKAAEEFLRFAEPPAHNDWDISNGIRARYVWGAGAKIRELFDEMVRKLKEFVGSSQESGEDVPDILRDIFRITDAGKPNQSSYKLLVPKLFISGDLLQLNAEVECPDSTGHLVRVMVTFAPESGKGLEMRWTSLETSVGTVDGGKILVPRGSRRLQVSGTLESTISGMDLSRCAYQVSIRGTRSSVQS